MIYIYINLVPEDIYIYSIALSIPFKADSAYILNSDFGKKAFWVSKFVVTFSSQKMCLIYISSNL